MPLLIVLLYFFLFVFTLACFSPMFMKHARRRKRLLAMTLNGGESHARQSFEDWRSNWITNAVAADIAAVCLAGIWLCPIFPSTVGAALVWLFVILACVLGITSKQHRKAAIKAKDGSFQAVPIKELDRR